MLRHDHHCHGVYGVPWLPHDHGFNIRARPEGIAFVILRDGGGDGKWGFSGACGADGVEKLILKENK